MNEQERVIAEMAKKRSSVLHKIEIVKEKAREHSKESGTECTPIARSLANASPSLIQDNSPFAGEYNSPDAKTFDLKGLKDLEQKKSSMGDG